MLQARGLINSNNKPSDAAAPNDQAKHNQKASNTERQNIMDELTEQQKNILIDALIFFGSIEHRNEATQRFNYTDKEWAEVEALEEQIREEL